MTSYVGEVRGVNSRWIERELQSGNSYITIVACFHVCAGADDDHPPATLPATIAARALVRFRLSLPPLSRETRGVGSNWHFFLCFRITIGAASGAVRVILPITEHEAKHFARIDALVTTSPHTRNSSNNNNCDNRAEHRDPLGRRLPCSRLQADWAEPLKACQPLAPHLPHSRASPRLPLAAPCVQRPPRAAEQPPRHPPSATRR